MLQSRYHIYARVIAALKRIGFQEDNSTGELGMCVIDGVKDAFGCEVAKERVNRY